MTSGDRGGVSAFSAGKAESGGRRWLWIAAIAVALALGLWGLYGRNTRVGSTGANAARTTGESGLDMYNRAIAIMAENGSRKDYAEAYKLLYLAINSDNLGGDLKMMSQMAMERLQKEAPPAEIEKGKALAEALRKSGSTRR